MCHRTFVVLLLRVAGAKHLQDAHSVCRAALLQTIEGALVEVVQLDLHRRCFFNKMLMPDALGDMHVP